MARIPSLLFWSQRRTGVLALAKLSTDAGQVGIAWKSLRRERCEVARPGMAGARGPPVRETGKREFGTRLISGGARCELGGTVSLEFAARGLRRSFDAPLRRSR